jgi:hypothetical protein
MNLAILRNIPWREIIDGTHAVVAMVQNKRRQPAPQNVNADAGVNELRERVRALESSQRGQAEAVSNMAEQGEKLAKAVQVLSARVVLLAWVAGGSLLLSLVLAGRMFLV